MPDDRVSETFHSFPELRLGDLVILKELLEIFSGKLILARLDYLDSLLPSHPGVPDLVAALVCRSPEAELQELEPDVDLAQLLVDVVVGQDIPGQRAGTLLEPQFFSHLVVSMAVPAVVVSEVDAP